MGGPGVSHCLTTTMDSIRCTVLLREPRTAPKPYRPIWKGHGKNSSFARSLVRWSSKIVHDDVPLPRTEWNSKRESRVRDSRFVFAVRFLFVRGGKGSEHGTDHRRAPPRDHGRRRPGRPERHRLGAFLTAE